MITAFKALAQAGAPDALALANGISEALINTAFGIGTSAVAIVMYNYFNTKIEKIIKELNEIKFTFENVFIFFFTLYIRFFKKTSKHKFATVQI